MKITIWCHVRTVTSSSTSLSFLPVAHDGTSQEDTDEDSILGDDGGDASKRDGTDDRADTSADCREDGDDHTSSPSPSSRHINGTLVCL